MKIFCQKIQNSRSQAVQNAVKTSFVQTPLKITFVSITLKKQGCLCCRFLGLTSRDIASQNTVRLYGTLCSAVITGTAASSPLGRGGRSFPRPKPQHKGDSDSCTSPLLRCCWATLLNEWAIILKLLQRAHCWLGANTFSSFIEGCYFICECPSSFLLNDTGFLFLTEVTCSPKASF